MILNQTPLINQGKRPLQCFFHQFVFEWSLLRKAAHLLMKNESENRTDPNLKDYFSKIRRFDPSERFQRSLIEPK